jgi:hypothetical protein
MYNLAIACIASFVTTKTPVMNKRIDHILAGRNKQITSTETVRQPLPHKDFRFANPFIVIHHIGPAVIEKGKPQRIHPHPHRGFSPYTFMIQGEGFHRDNAGNDETVAAGGVQWMFAGKGILHSEGPTQKMIAEGGVQELVQLWINAPKDRKYDKPFYQSATKEQLPLVLQQQGVQFALASGDYEGQTGPIQNFTPVVSMRGEIAAGKSVHLQAQPGYWTLLYVIKGHLTINNTAVEPYHLVVFEKDNTDIHLTAQDNAMVLYLSAEPIDEPVAAKDNFVMNTAEEVEQAIADYKNGVFGSLSS